jgi:hypothetical protein
MVSWFKTNKVIVWITKGILIIVYMYNKLLQINNLEWSLDIYKL